MLLARRPGTRSAVRRGLEGVELGVEAAGRGEVVVGGEVAGADGGLGEELEASVILERRGGAGAPLGERKGSEVGAVDGDASAGGLIHAGEQLGDGRFSGAVFSDDGD